MYCSARRWLLFGMMIMAAFCMIIYVQHLSRINGGYDGANDVSSYHTKKVAHLRVVDYSAFSLVEKIECVPLKTALHEERICIYEGTTDSFISNVLRLTGSWEAEIFVPLSKVVGACPDCQFLDIGSNIGVYAVTLASMGRSVLAVEPLYANLLRLTKSIRMNKLENKVTIITNPVSDVYENVTLWVPGDNPGGTHVASKGIKFETFQKVTEEVPTIYLDDLIPLINFTKAIMKVDIEGYEAKAFRKAAKLFQTVEIKYVFMEWLGKNDLPLYDISPLIDFFTSRGFAANDLNFGVLPSGLEGFRKWPKDIIWVRA